MPTLLSMLVLGAAVSVPVLPAPSRVFPGAVSFERGEDGRTIRWAEGALGKVDGLDEASIVRFVTGLGARLGLDDAANELVLESLEADELGMRHARFTRTHAGLPVVESDLVFHFANDGTLRSVNGHYPPSLSLPPLSFSVDVEGLERRAVEEATVALRSKGESPGKAAHVESRLVVVGTPARQALEVEVRFGLHQGYRLYLDVHRGTVLKTRSLIQTNATGSGKDSLGVTRPLNLVYNQGAQTYEFRDTTSGSGGSIFTLTANYTESSGTIVTSNSTNVSNPPAVDVHANMRVIYDYFKREHGRTSWDGRGANVISYIHYGRNWPNAAWTGQEMIFGDGDGRQFLGLHRCLDVAAHELSHAVITGTVDLVYERQSGALNEHFADVFGALVDDRNWTMGEDCMGPRGGAFLRSFSNPRAGDQPDHMRDYANLPNTEDGDWGGVHINSGIVNKAAYLVAQRLDRKRLGRVWYRMLDKKYLNARSQFIDMRRGALRACNDLLPAGDCVHVADAFDSVGIVDAGSGSGGECPPNSSLYEGQCYCNEGYKPNAQGTGCERAQTLSCPPNSHQQGEYCYCDDGFVVNAQGTGCERDGASCPAHSHREGNRCVCDEGYQGTPTQGYGCEKIQDDCPPNSVPSPTDPGMCQCIAGWVPNAAGTECVPGKAGCGAETYYGRCIGDTLVYCFEEEIKTIDCTRNGWVCRLENLDSGNNCIEAPADPCGGLTYLGECRNNAMRWCEGDTIREVDCKDRPCIDAGGDVGFSCDPCPANASYRDGSCYCNDGYRVDETQRQCVKASGSEPCPDNASYVNDACYCNEGYRPNKAGDGCIVSNVVPDDRCPENASVRESDEQCYCDEGYKANAAGNGCEQMPLGSTNPGDSSGGRDAGRAASRSSGCASGEATAGVLLLPLLLLLRRRKAWAVALVGALSLGCAKSAPEVVPNDPPAPLATEPRPVVKAPPLPAPSIIPVREGTRFQSDDGTLELVVRDVVPSSLCPPGVRCVWAGEPAHVLVDATVDEVTETFKLFEKRPVVLGAWEITAIAVAPPDAELTARRIVVKPEED